MHGEIKDLVITLSHEGILDTLVMNPYGGGVNMLHSRFHPAASCDAQAGTAPMSGVYRPYRPTTLFSGTSVNGDWELKIYDSQAGNTGTLQSWELQIYYESMVGNEELPVIKESPELRAFPNPLSSTLNVRVSEDGTFRVLDISGRVVNSGLLRSGINKIDVSDLSTGLYFLEADFGTEKLTRKLIKK
jgi:hypothetical protein